MRLATYSKAVAHPDVAVAPRHAHHQVMAETRRRLDANSTPKLPHEEEYETLNSHEETSSHVDAILERRLLRKIDFRLCSIAAILCSLNLLDSGIISSASVTSMREDLGLYGNRYSVSIFIFTVSSIAFQLPSTVAVRKFGPRIWFSAITCAFGIVTLSTAFIHSWREMIALRASGLRDEGNDFR